MQINRCISCEQEITAYPCPHCGFDAAAYRQPEYALPCDTVLHGRYLVGKMLGQGGFGITYVGWDLALQLKVAIKEYYPNGQVTRSGSVMLNWYTGTQAAALRESGMQTFLREARKMAKVEQIREVVRVRDTFVENETAYIVMDFVEGETLKSRLERKGILSWDQCQRIFFPVIAAMERVHETGLVHRDLSPDNLMLLPDGSVKILDLGAAKDLTVGSGQSSMQVAKGGFSPIEQYTQHGGSGPWSDVYAIAATMYYSLTGVLPPPSTDRLDALVNQKEDPLKLDLPQIRALPKPVVTALRNAMETPAQSRTQSMGKFRKELSAPREKRPFPWKAVGIGAACCVLAASIGVAWAWMPKFHYQRAQKALEEGNYEAAIEAFSRSGGFEDAEIQMEEAQKAAAYRDAEALLAEGNYQQAAEGYEALGDYLDCKEKVVSCYLQVARGAESQGNYQAALEDYTHAMSLGSSEAADELYDLGFLFLKEEDYDQASAAFAASGKAEDYRQYAEARKAYGAENWDGAAEKLLPLLDKVTKAPGWDQFFCDLGFRLLNESEQQFADARTLFAFLSQTPGLSQTLSGKVQEGLETSMVAEAVYHMNNGDLRAARDAIANAPEGAVFREHSKAQIQATLTEYNRFVDVCGKWSIFDATIRCNVSQGSHLKAEGLTPGGFIQVKCYIQPDGRVRIKGQFDQTLIHLVYFGMGKYGNMFYDSLSVTEEQMVEKHDLPKLKDDNEYLYSLSCFRDILTFEHNFVEEVEKNFFVLYHQLYYRCKLESTTPTW